MTIRVLVVDDEVGMLIAYRRTLKALKYEICGTAQNYEEAIQAALETDPDIIIMDISLGRNKSDGIDAAREINSRLDVPVIFVSAFGNTSDAERIVEPWSYGFIKKPFDLMEIQSSIELAVNKYRTFKYEKELLKRDSILKAVNSAATLFLSKDPFEESLSKTIELIGKAIDSSYICLYRNFGCSSDIAGAELICEWSGPDNPCLRDSLAKEVIYDDSFSALKNVLYAGEILQIDENTSDPCKCLLFSGKGIVVNIPVFCGSFWWGFLSIGMESGNESGMDIEIEALGTAASILGSALNQEIMHDALLKSEEEYRSLYKMMRLMCDNVPDAIWVKGKDRKYSFVNRTFAEDILKAKDTDEPIGKTMDYFATRERASRPGNGAWYTVDKDVLEVDSKVLKTGNEINIESEIYIDGEKKYLDIYRAPFHDDEGKLIGVVGCARDETKRNDIEHNLRELNERFETFMDALPGHAFIKSPDGTIIYVNLNNSLDDQIYMADWIGKKETEVFSGLDPEIITKSDFNALNNGFQNMVEIVSIPEGGERIYNILKFPVESADGGRLIGGIVLDITDKNIAENALIESEERYRQLVENIRVKILISQDENIVYANQCLFDFLGIPPEEFEGKNFDSFICPEDLETVVHYHRRRLSGDNDLPVNYRVHCYSCDGEPRLHELTTTLIKWNGKWAILNFLIDIEDENRAKEELERSLQEKILLLEEVHHRVKNNLALINSLIMMQIRNIRQPEIREGLLMARTRIFSIASVHEGLYRSDSISSIPAKEHFKKIGEEILENYDPARRLTLEITGDEVELNLGVATHISLVINELLINAIKYAYPDGIGGIISINLGYTGDVFEIRVRDEGVGIPEGFSLEEAKSLGMSLVRNIITSQLEGRISLGLGKGTEWIIEIPIEL